MKAADLDTALATVHSKYQPAGSHQPRGVPVPGHLPGAAERRGRRAEAGPADGDQVRRGGRRLGLARPRPRLGLHARTRC